MIDAFAVLPPGVKAKLDVAADGNLRIHQDELHFNPARPPARYVGGRWEMDQKRFAVLRIESPVTIHLERDGERSEPLCGPVAPVFVVDGVVFCEGQEQSIADFGAIGPSWWQPSTGEQWTTVVFTKA